MSPLFGNHGNDEAIAKNMESLSQQIGNLSRQLAERNEQIASLQQQLEEAQGAAANAKSQELATAQKHNSDLQQQIASLQQQLESLQSQRYVETNAAESAHTTAAPSAAGGLSTGSTAYVTRAGGLPLRLRSGGGLNHSVVGRLDPGTSMTLLSGPEHADGHAWWHIRTSDGREGWVAGEDLRSQPD